MFGRVPRLPVDMFLGLSTDYNTSVSSIQERLEAAYKSANEAAKLAKKHQAKGYNTKIRGHKLNKGDFVLVKNVGLKGKHKLCLGPIGDFCIGDGEMYNYTRDASRCLAILSIKYQQS